MGMRALANIDGNRFYLQWGSPEFQLQHFGTWLTACRMSGAVPSADNYVALVQALGLHGFTERMEDGYYLTPEDLDWSYRVTIDTGTDPETGDDTWTVHIDLAGPCLSQSHRNELLADIPAAWTVWADQDGTHDVARKIAELATAGANRVPDPQQAQVWHDIAARWSETAGV